MMSGSSSLIWKDFEDLVDLLRGTPAFLRKPCIPEILASRITRLTLRRRAGSQSSLHDLLREYSDSACTERRDKIYGILGLASDCIENPETGEAQGLAADYERLVVQVFMDALACVRASLPSDVVLPAAILLILQALHITNADVTEYLQQFGTSLKAGLNESLIVTPGYVSPILKVWSWTSVRDLQQQLEAYDWGQYIGYEMTKVPSLQLSSPGRVPKLRRNSSRPIHSALPADFVPNVVDAANRCMELHHLHNYPCHSDLRVPLEHLPLHSDDKRVHNNQELRKPPLILEQSAEGEILRLGFASTNVQRGDLILQFQGLDATLVARQIGFETTLIGKAMMVRHSDLVYEGELDPICDVNVWSSYCWGGRNSEGLRFETDALSLVELLMRPDT